LTSDIFGRGFDSRRLHQLIFNKLEDMCVVQTRNKKLVPKNPIIIIKVYEVLPRPRQTRLDGGKDDEPPSRSITFGDV